MSAGHLALKSDNLLASVTITDGVDVGADRRGLGRRRRWRCCRRWRKASALVVGALEHISFCGSPQQIQGKSVVGEDKKSDSNVAEPIVYLLRETYGLWTVILGTSNGDVPIAH